MTAYGNGVSLLHHTRPRAFICVFVLLPLWFFVREFAQSVLAAAPWRSCRCFEVA